MCFCVCVNLTQKHNLSQPFVNLGFLNASEWTFASTDVSQYTMKRYVHPSDKVAL